MIGRRKKLVRNLLRGGERICAAWTRSASTNERIVHRLIENGSREDRNVALKVRKKRA